VTDKRAVIERLAIAHPDWSSDRLKQAVDDVFAHLAVVDAEAAMEKAAADLAALPAAQAALAAADGKPAPAEPAGPLGSVNGAPGGWGSGWKQQDADNWQATVDRAAQLEAAEAAEQQKRPKGW
jgi:hypothetical protein